MNTDVFSNCESEVRSYCRAFPAVFSKAKGAELFCEEGKRYIDFFAGAGALNYGHNPGAIKNKLIDYLQSDNIIHGLDMFTSAKRTFMENFNEKILRPKGLDYKMQFCGPTGTNAVESALKLARKVKGRSGIFAFQGGFHGMSLGSLAVTGNRFNREGAGVGLGDVTFMPYPHGFMNTFDTIGYIDCVLGDSASGIDKPAAIILESTQAEGGVVVAPVEWLKRLRRLCDKHDILMIVDDIQVGCGRTGTYFSFERAGVTPDIVTLSKAVSGYGLPFAMVLFKPELDRWLPGEHSGTFRGNQMAFVGGTAAIDAYFHQEIESQVRDKQTLVQRFVQSKILSLDDQLALRGVGLIWGIDLGNSYGGKAAGKIISRCFEHGLLIENAGRDGRVVKLLPPLNIDNELLLEGLEILAAAFKAALQANITPVNSVVKPACAG